MEAYSSSSGSKSNSRIFPNYFQRSVSPSGHFCSSSISSSNSMSGSSRSSSGFLTRPTSPSRVNLRGSVSPTSSSSSSIRYSTSPSRSITFSNHKQKKNNNNNNNNKEWSSIREQKKTCVCSPTTHPGSFRCSLHKSVEGSHRRHQHQTASYHSHGLDARRSAMTNSLVRIGTAEGELVKRALAALIRPSSHQQKRRADFQPLPTRLSVMSKPHDV